MRNPSPRLTLAITTALSLLTCGAACASAVAETGFTVTTFATGLSHNPRGIAVAPAERGFTAGEVFISHRGTVGFDEQDYISRVDATGTASTFAALGSTDPGALEFGKGGFNGGLWVANNTSSFSGPGDGRVVAFDANGVVVDNRHVGGSGSGGIDFDTFGDYRGAMYLGLTGYDGVVEVGLTGRSVLPVFSDLGPLSGGPVGIQFGRGGAFGTGMYVSVASFTPRLMLSGVYRLAVDGTPTPLVTTATSSLITTPGLDGLAFGPGGDFGTDLYMTDKVQGTIVRIRADGSTSVFASGFNDPSGIAFDSVDALYVVESGTGSVIRIAPENAPAFSCSGFDHPVVAAGMTVRGNRALPLKAQLFSQDGVEIAADGVQAPPVLQVLYSAAGATAPIDVTADALEAGQGTDGNQFVYSDGRWRFNLKTQNYTAPGDYFLALTSGDDSEYRVEPECGAVLIVQ